MSDPYRMVYCDNIGECRVNTFEVGDGYEERKGPGHCPACYELGNCLTCHAPINKCGCDE